MTTDSDLQRATAAIRAGQFRQAQSILSEILLATPSNLQARWMLVQTLEQLQDKEEVLIQLQSLLVHVKKDLSAIDQIASYLQQKRYPLRYVLRAYKKFLAYRPGSANAAYNYAYYLARDGQFDTAVKTYKRTLELGIDAPEEVHLNIANIYTDHLRDNERARHHLQLALERNPAYVGAYHNLGNLSEQDGNREEATRYFEKCLEIDSANEGALARLADIHKFVDRDDPLLAKLAAVALKANNSDVDFALGKAYEQLAEFDMAWQNFSKGNERDRLTFPTYRWESREAFFARIKHCFDSEWFTRHEGLSHAPVFICGMFRTGSTLLEQVLASHPAFDAGGESEFFPRLVQRQFPDFPNGLDSVSADKLLEWGREHLEYSRKLTGKSNRLIDKRPDNFLYIGLIKAILPSARFVVTERDWRDVATSIFSTRLASSQNYATTLKGIRHFIGLQKQLIDHWQSLLGDDLIRVRYEDLVSEPRAIVGALLEGLGEDWDDRCLSFHQLDNTVQTASVWQVREPFHKRSIGRWKNYKKFFKNAFSGDGDF